MLKFVIFCAIAVPCVLCLSAIETAKAGHLPANSNYGGHSNTTTNGNTFPVYVSSPAKVVKPAAVLNVVKPVVKEVSTPIPAPAPAPAPAPSLAPPPVQVEPPVYVPPVYPRGRG